MLTTCNVDEYCQNTPADLRRISSQAPQLSHGTFLFFFILLGLGFIIVQLYHLYAFLIVPCTFEFLLNGGSFRTETTDPRTSYFVG